MSNRGILVAKHREVENGATPELPEGKSYGKDDVRGTKIPKDLADWLAEIADFEELKIGRVRAVSVAEVIDWSPLRAWTIARYQRMLEEKAKRFRSEQKPSQLKPGQDRLSED